MKKTLLLFSLLLLSHFTYAQVYVRTGSTSTFDFNTSWNASPSTESAIWSIYSPENGPGSGIAGIVGNFKYDVNYGFQLGNVYGDPGNLYFRLRYNGNYGNWLKMWHSGNFNPANENLQAVTERSPITSAHITMNAGNNLYFRSDDAGDIVFQAASGTEYSRIYSASSTLNFSAGPSPFPMLSLTGSNGTVPIRLSLRGEFYCKKIKVNQTGWPDFVFHENYQLPTLSAVEAYIQENGHLEGFKPAEVVEKEGADLAETDRKLLQKIEELTLYVIALNKKCEALEKMLAEANSRTEQ